MELSILTDQCRKEFAGISGHKLGYSKNCVQDKSPDFLRNRQLKRLIGYLPEDSTDGLIRVEPLDRAEYVVLHHCQCEAGYLSREMDGLALSQVEQGLHVPIQFM